MSDTVSLIGAVEVPLAALPSQTVNVTLGPQACTIDVYQTDFGLFISLYVQDALVIGGVVCRNTVKIVRDLYLGFVGDLAFFDTQGTADPDYTGLGDRFVLTYLPPL